MRYAQERRIELIELSMRDRHPSAQGNRLHADCNIFEHVWGVRKRLANGYGVRPGDRAAHTLSTVSYRELMI